MHTEAPCISVIIPVFNDPDGLEQCLDGLAQQSYPLEQFEVIVVDNASQPPITISTRLPFTTSLCRCEKPGSYAARNTGARAANGDILAFTDADCIPDKAWLSEGVKALAETDGATAIGGEVIVLPPLTKTATGLYQYLVGFQQQQNISLKNFSVTANLFCSKRQFYRVGEFDEKLLSGGDLEWGWRAYEKGLSTAFVPTAIIKTEPRTSLRKAIIQARRVAGGRRILRESYSHALSKPATRSHRPLLKSITWILKNKNLTRWQRIKVLFAASAIKLAYIYESILLSIGKQPERR